MLVLVEQRRSANVNLANWNLLHYPKWLTMKTIRNLKKQIWQRVTEQEARAKVGVAGWEYCPKSEWKENVRDASKEKKKD